MKKAFVTYLKKVQKLQQMLLGDRTIFVNSFHHVYDDGDVINSFSVSVKDNSEEFSHFNFYESDSEHKYETDYKMLCFFLREQGCNV